MSNLPTNPSNHHPESDAELDRHIAAMRDEPMPQGPSADALAKTQAMFATLSADQSVTKGSSEQKSIVNRRRSFMERLAIMSFAQRIVAVVMITLGALTLYVLFGLFNALAPQVAFADVVQKFKTAHTFSLVTSAEVPGKPGVKMKMQFKDPDMVRMEMPGGMIMISAGGKSILINDKARTVMVTTLDGQKIHRPGTPDSIVEAMRSLSDTKGTPAGEKTIDGVACVGFNAVHAGQPITVWANKKTAQPVRVEMKMSMGGKDITMVMDHFELDPPLEDAVFSLEPPAGYALETQTIKMPKLGPLDEEVAKLLADYAKASGGVFPSSLTDWSAIMQTASKAKQTDPAAIGNMMARVGSISGQLFSLPNGYTYNGKGAKLGDKNKLIFWYRKDAKSPTYRGIFGDLRIEDVPADKIPSTQATTP